MTLKSPLFNGIAALTLTSLSLIGCGPSKMQQTAEVVDSPLNDEGPYDLESMRAALESAKAENIHLISPRWYGGALNLFESGKAEDLRKSRSLLNKAYASALPVQERMQPLLAARADAIEADAITQKSFEDVESRFLKMTAELDSEFRGRAIGQIPELTDAFRSLERSSIEAKYLGSARTQIAIAEREGAKDLVPKTLSQAKQSLKTAEEFIKQDPKNEEMITQLGEKAAFDGSRLVALTRQVKDWNKMSREEVALKTEGLLGIVSSPAQIDLRNKSFEAQATELAARYSGFATDKAELQQATQKVEALEAKTKSLSALEKEKRENQKFETVQSMFSEEEAKVYREGNTLFISLKQIAFPSGQSEIPTRSFSLLEKVNKAVKVFDRPVVIVEGHTDATGAEAVNKRLSEERAEAVKKYLSSVNEDEKFQLSSVGFGSEKPLASNKSKEGRAINRRIDVVIKSAM